VDNLECNQDVDQINSSDYQDNLEEIQVELEKKQDDNIIFMSDIDMKGNDSDWKSEEYKLRHREDNIKSENNTSFSLNSESLKKENGFKNRRSNRKIVKMRDSVGNNLSHKLSAEYEKIMAVVEHGYACMFCDTKLTQKFEMKNHYMKEHANEDIKLTRKLAEIDQFSTDSQTEEDDKMMTKIGPSIWSCKVCSKEMKNKENLRRHYLLHRGREEYKLKCSECGTRFRSKFRLLSHMLYKHDTQLHKTHPCDYNGCGYKAFTYKDLAKHRKIHSEYIDKHVCSWP
jgi:hypothetical protein